jgi:hypothetical protein
MDEENAQEFRPRPALLSSRLSSKAARALHRAALEANCRADPVSFVVWITNEGALRSRSRGAPSAAVRRPPMGCKLQGFVGIGNHLACRKSARSSCCVAASISAMPAAAASNSSTVRCHETRS